MKTHALLLGLTLGVSGCFLAKEKPSLFQSRLFGIDSGISSERAAEAFQCALDLDDWDNVQYNSDKKRIDAQKMLIEDEMVSAIKIVFRKPRGKRLAARIRITYLEEKKTGNFFRGFEEALEECGLPEDSIEIIKDEKYHL